MLGSIMAKLSDAGSMFWQALDERERMILLYGVIYLGYTVVYALAERDKRSERETLRSEILAELRGNA